MLSLVISLGLVCCICMCISSSVAVIAERVSRVKAVENLLQPDIKWQSDETLPSDPDFYMIFKIKDDLLITQEFENKNLRPENTTPLKRDYIKGALEFTINEQIFTLKESNDKLIVTGNDNITRIFKKKN